MQKIYVCYLPVWILFFVTALEWTDVRLLGGQLRSYAILEMNARQMVLNIKQGDYFKCTVLYSTLFHLPPENPLCRRVLGSNLGLLRLRHWQSDALTTRLDLIHKPDFIHNPDLIHIKHTLFSLLASLEVLKPALL